MHILILLHKIGPYHHARFNELAKACKLTVIEILPNSAEYDWRPIDNIANYEVIKIQEHLNTELPGKKLMRRISSLIYNADPDVVITTGWSNRSYFAALLAAKKADIPVLSLSDSNISDYKRNFFIEFIKSCYVRLFDGFVVAGKRSKQYLLKLKFNPDYIFQPCDVVDNLHFQSRSLQLPDFDYFTPYLLCISRFIPKKNLLLLIQTYHQYIQLHSEEKTQLIIVGSGPMKTQLQEMITTLKSTHIKLYPFIQYEYLPGVYQHAKALILSSIADQWGLAVNEAMAAGIPVIVSKNCGCVDDLVIEGENGWVIEPTEEGIMRGLENFFNCEDLQLKAMGERGKKIIENFDLKDFKIATFALIDRLKGRKRKLNFLQKFLVFLRLYA
jgi:glycosyltransferase involved in cell wall biosynthesis